MEVKKMMMMREEGRALMMLFSVSASPRSSTPHTHTQTVTAVILCECVTRAKFIQHSTLLGIGEAIEIGVAIGIGQKIRKL